MKKTVVSVVIIGAFVLYCFFYGHSGFAPVIPTTAVESRPSSSATDAASTSTPNASATPGATVTPAPGARYKDGSYTGSVDDAQWGVVQVKAIITNGKITDVQFLQYPNDRSRSVYINSIADPQLTSEEYLWSNHRCFVHPPNSCRTCLLHSRAGAGPWQRLLLHCQSEVEGFA